MGSQETTTHAERRSLQCSRTDARVILAQEVAAQEKAAKMTAHDVVVARVNAATTEGVVLMIASNESTAWAVSTEAKQQPDGNGYTTADVTAKNGQYADALYIAGATPLANNSASIVTT